MTRMRPHANQQRGAGLLETVTALGVIAILAFSFGFMVPTSTEANREARVREQLLRVKKALIGEPSNVRRGQINLNRFGYMGDMGTFPGALEDLVEVGVQPDYVVADIIQLGTGWRGPYIATDPLDFLEDPWGNPLDLDTTVMPSAVTGSTVIATLSSAGADGFLGTGDDHIVEIYEGEASSDLFGYIRDTSGNTISGVVVTLSRAENGLVATDVTSTNEDGLYEFGFVPHGERVIQIDPKLAYQKETAFTTNAFLNDVEFTIENLGQDDSTVSSFTLTYSSSPAAYFQQVWINDVQVFDSVNPRAGTDDLITFPNEVVAGTDVIQAPFHLVVSSLAFQVPELSIDTVGIGGTLRIELQDFRDATTGGGAARVNMTGVTFGIVFSDGSTTLFTTKQVP